MNYLLDTCILSKSRKANPNFEKLRDWLNQHPETSYHISVVSIGEIQAGISKLDKKEAQKKLRFENWLYKELIPRFKYRILEVDIQTCSIWGQLRGEAQKKGRPLPAIDALIAASAIQHRCTLVTENTKDFFATGVDLINPLS